MPVTISTAFLVVAIVFGGGGSPSPGPELVVQLAAIGALVAWAIIPSRLGSLTQGRATSYSETSSAPSKAIAIGAALLLAIPLLQLVPLPPGLWSALPGREAQAEAMQLTGQPDHWRALSVSPFHTTASALSLIPPIVMLLWALRLTGEARTRLIAVVIALGVLSALVGTVQLASGNADWLRFYGSTHYGVVTGFQANRNATADLFLIALLAVWAYSAMRKARHPAHPARFTLVAVAILLAICVVLTGSRTGIALLGLVALAWLTFTFLRSWSLRRAAIGLAVATLVAAGVVAMARNAPVVERMLARFERGEQARPELWTDTMFAIEQYWPLGSGIGTASPVLVAAERLEVVDDSRPNRVHNDYLEFALETGLVGIALLLVALIALAVRVIAVLRSRGPLEQRAQVAFAAGGLAVLALHSLVDYPMRSMSLACIAALLVGMLGSYRSGSSKAGASFTSGELTR